MRNTGTYRNDPSRTANSKVLEIALDTSLLDESTVIGNKSRNATGGGDAIAGLRNGLLLSAAFWAFAYFVVQLIVR